MLEEIGDRFDFGVQSLHPAILADDDCVFCLGERAESADFQRLSCRTSCAASHLKQTLEWVS